MTASLKVQWLPHSFHEDGGLLPMQEEVVVLVLAALTSQILDGIVDLGKGELQSAKVEVLDVNAVMAKVNVMNCSGAISGSACDAKKYRKISIRRVTS